MSIFPQIVPLGSCLLVLIASSMSIFSYVSQFASEASSVCSVMTGIPPWTLSASILFEIC